MQRLFTFRPSMESLPLQVHAALGVPEAPRRTTPFYSVWPLSAAVLGLMGMWYFAALPSHTSLWAVSTTSLAPPAPGIAQTQSRLHTSASHIGTGHMQSQATTPMAWSSPHMQDLMAGVAAPGSLWDKHRTLAAMAVGLLVGLFGMMRMRMRTWQTPGPASLSAVGPSWTMAAIAPEPPVLEDADEAQGLRDLKVQPCPISASEISAAPPTPTPPLTPERVRGAQVSPEPRGSDQPKGVCRSQCGVDSLESAWRSVALVKGSHAKRSRARVSGVRLHLETRN